MSANVIFGTNVLERLEAEDGCSVGLLLGRSQGDQIEVFSWATCPPNTRDLIAEADQVCLMLSAGISVVGIFYATDKAATDTDVESSLQNLNSVQLQTHLNRTSLLVCHKVRGSGSIQDDCYLQSSSSGLERCHITQSNEDVIERNCVLRLKTELPFNFELPKSGPKARKQIVTQVRCLCEKIRSEQSCAVYHVVNSAVLLRPWEGDGHTLTCAELSEQIITDEEEGELLKKNHHKETIHMSLLFQATEEQAFHSLQTTYAPIIEYRQESHREIELRLPLDVVAVVDPTLKCSQLTDILSEGLCNQLKAMEDCLLKQLGPEPVDTFHTPRVHHFRPMNSQCLFSVVYPEGVADENLESERKLLHKRLSLPQDRPLFRRTNVYLFPEDVNAAGYLRNPHIGLPSSNVKGGKQCVVAGNYTYHHYMQDRFDDDKWGCAYRSLQTLVSWFKLQGYTTRDIPSHREIQQALVDVGDKEPNFVGSRQWIGSFEVSICLDQFLGVTSKILYVNDGSEIASKGRELAVHFQTQGSPIMIGGGVLAHTILGVDFCEETGDIKFLILDPHYTGSEDIKVIQDKGWCGWKGPDFWVINAHYNLCMPQRPSVI